MFKDGWEVYAKNCYGNKNNSKLTILNILTITFRFSLFINCLSQSTRTFQNMYQQRPSDNAKGNVLKTM